MVPCVLQAGTVTVLAVVPQKGNLVAQEPAEGAGCERLCQASRGAADVDPALTVLLVESVQVGVVPGLG